MGSESGPLLFFLTGAMLLASVISVALLTDISAIDLFDEFVFILIEEAFFLTFISFMFIYVSVLCAILEHLTLKLKVEQRRQKNRWEWMRSESGPPSSFLKKYNSFFWRNFSVFFWVFLFGIPFLVITLLLFDLRDRVGAFPLVLSFWVSIASLVVACIVFGLFSASRERLTLKLKAEIKKAKGPVGVDRMRSELGSRLSEINRTIVSVRDEMRSESDPHLSESGSRLSESGSRLSEELTGAVYFLHIFIFIGVVLIPISWIFTMLNNFISREDTFSLVLGFWVSITSPVVAYIVFRLFSATRWDRLTPLKLKAETEKAKGPVGVDEMGSESGPPLSFLKKAIFAMLSPFLNAFWIRATVIWYFLIMCYFIFRLDTLSLILNVGAFLILTFVGYIVFGLFFSNRWVRLLKVETKKAK